MKPLTKSLLKIGGGVLATVLAWKSFYTVDQTQHAVITSFGNPVRVVLNDDAEKPKLDANLKQKYADEGISTSEGAGIGMKWFWQTANYIDRRIMRWDGWPEDLATRDKKNIWIDTTARWFVSDPLQYFRRLKTEEIANKKLSDILDSTQRDAIANHDLIELVRTDNRAMEITEPELRQTVEVGKISIGRVKMLEEISEITRKGCSSYGIKVHDVGILLRGLSYVDSVKHDVEGRMMSERNRIAEKYISEGNGQWDRIMGEKEREVKKIRSEGYRIAKETEGAGEAEATRIYALGFINKELGKDGKPIREYPVRGLNTDPEFYAFVRTMMLLESGMGGKGKARVVIGTDNPIAKFLKGDYSAIDVNSLRLPTTRPSLK